METERWGSNLGILLPGWRRGERERRPSWNLADMTLCEDATLGCEVVASVICCIGWGGWYATSIGTG